MKHRVPSLLLLAAVALAAAAPGPEANTTFGRVVGFTKDGVDIWWNIPYAAAPVGDRRFRPPVDPQPWTSALDCTATPRMCPQNHVNKTNKYTGEEDCLIVNVYAPSGRSPQQPLPVMAFIHGGGFNSGSGYSFGVPIPVLDSLYDGQNLARRENVIVVTLNYRLAILGFLALKELAAEQQDGTTGNYGVQDQRHALQWVQNNIRNFGGDPKRVMMFGESAGGVSVCYHLTSPASKGLFSAAIAESPVCTGRIPFADLAVAQNFGDLWVQHFGCNKSSAADTLACLRSLSTSQVLDWPNDTPAILPPNPPGHPPLPLLMPPNPWWPTVDHAASGVVDQPLEMIRSGRFNNVPTIMGTNRDEGTLFVNLVTQVIPGVKLPINEQEFLKTLQYFFLNNQTVVDMIVKEYPPTVRYDHVLANVLRDFLFSCPARAVLRAINEHRASVGDVTTHSYLYSFNRTAVNFPLWPYIRDFHGLELFYVFDRPIPFLFDWTPDDQQLADEMGTYWSSFTATGDPNALRARCPTCIPWPAYNATADGAGDVNIVFKKGLITEQGLFQEHCTFWDSIGF